MVTEILSGRPPNGSGGALFRLALFLGGVSAIASLSIEQANAQADPARITANMVNSAIQTAVENARERAFDQIQRDNAARANPGRPLGYAEDSEFDEEFRLLGYASQARNPLYTKAPPAPPPAPAGPQWAAWGQASYDYERTTGNFNNGFTTANIGSVSNAWGGQGGLDVTIPFTGGALVLGGLGGQTDTKISTAIGGNITSKAPTAAAYAVLVLGDFSVDGSYSTSWISSDSSGVITSPTVGTSGLGNLSTRTISTNGAGNIQYRFNFTNNWWLEPTAGLSYTQLVEDMGLPDQETDHWQAGARAGTSFMWGSTKVEEVFTGLAYSDWSIKGGVFPGSPATSNDEGQLWGKGIAKINFVWTQNFSGFLQGEVHGTRGLENVIGYVGTGGLRYQF